MTTTGHENEPVNVNGLKAALQTFKTNHVDVKATKTELAALEASSIKSGTKFTSSSGTQYTAGQILTAMADLMDKSVVADITT